MLRHTQTNSNILTLQIWNLLNLCLVKPKEGSPLSPNAALPLSQQAALGSSVDVIIAVQIFAFLSGLFPLCEMTH